MNIFNKILLCTMLILFRNDFIEASTTTSTVTWPQSSVTAIITNITSQGALPYPYESLQQDPGTGMYIVIAPSPIPGVNLTPYSAMPGMYILTSLAPTPGITLIASPTTSGMPSTASPVQTYTFFNVPNNFPSVNGKPAVVAATYDVNGNLLAIIQGAAYTSLAAQYGIAINAPGIQPPLPATTNNTGVQSLGACNQQPFMQLDPADLALSPGTSGKSMICSNNAAFPSPGITSPVSYKNSSFYFYYNNLMQVYFAMQVTGRAISYINLSNGCTYNLDGSSQVINNPVGTASSGNQNDLFLPYVNADGYLQCMMELNGAVNSYSDYTNTEADFIASVADPATSKLSASHALVGVNAPNTNVTVYQMPLPLTPTPPQIAAPILPIDLTIPTTYNVYWNPPTANTYTINATYQWQCLQILPINMTSHISLNPIPADSYTKAGIILKNNVVYAIIFNGTFFTVNPGTNTNNYNLNSASSNATMTIAIDNTTNVKYVSIVANGITYNYQYQFLTLSPTQLQNYQLNAWLLGQATSSDGDILLVKNLPNNSSLATAQLSPVTINMVQNIPSNSAIQNTVNSALKNIVQDVPNNRFLTIVSATANSGLPFYSYLTENSYVDLATGILFTMQGVTIGNSLLPADLNALLAQLSVNVVISNNKAVLSYTSTTPNPIIPTIPTDMTDTIDSTYTTYSANPITPAAPITTTQQIAALQTQNATLQNDIINDQTEIKSLEKNAKNPNSTHQITIDKNKIAINDQQINLNNSQIATLQAETTATATTSSRSTLLGRFNSKKLHNKKSKRSVHRKFL